MRKIFKRLGLFVAAPFFIIILYLLGALLGGLIPSSGKNSNANAAVAQKTIYLTANAMHADIAIPINDLTLAQFSFLRKTGFPLDNPNLKYLVIGWGGREFYTSTADYTDMKVRTIWRAVTGDASVMHIAPAGDVSKTDNAVELKLSDQGFSDMVEFILSSFQMKSGDPIILPGAAFGYGDLFYEAKGRFHIFNPCNVWVSKALDEAGISTGIWTPTTYSLLLHNRLYN